ncbi:MAG: AzlC family ABC transporter permease [Bacillota bacterium]
MGKRIHALKTAFPATIPVLLGYLFVGIAFGMLLEEKGYSFIWAFFVSLSVYAGSMQFVMLSFLSCGAGLIEVALMTLAVNFRHVFYGLSMLDSFKGMGKKKPYMIHALTDETYSLLCAVSVPAGVDPHLYRFSIAVLNHIYWIAGSVIGAVAGSLVTFNTTGIDFAMTALFVVIFIEQWMSYATHIPALAGLASAVLALLILGAGNFIIPAMLISTCALITLRHRLAPVLCAQEEGGVEHGS